MAKLKNISNGPRGAYSEGNLVMAEPGQEIEADDYSDEWFEVLGGEPDPLPVGDEGEKPVPNRQGPKPKQR